jgi:hypothetical protein
MFGVLRHDVARGVVQVAAVQHGAAPDRALGPGPGAEAPRALADFVGCAPGMCMRADR